MTDELKLSRCGCGSEAFSHMIGNAETHGYYICCEECGTKTAIYDTLTEVITAWNRAMGTDVRTLMKVFAYDATCAVCEKKKDRTAKMETVEKPNVFKCSECGQYFHSTAWGSPVEYCSRCGAKLDWSERHE